MPSFLSGGPVEVGHVDALAGRHLLFFEALQSLVERQGSQGVLGLETGLRVAAVTGSGGVVYRQGANMASLDRL